jgi:hypothetical protein
VEAAHHEAVAVRIEDRQGEALVPPGVLERIEADERDAAEGAAEIALEARRPGLEAVDVLNDLVHAREVRAEHPLEARSVLAPGEARQPPRQRTRPAEQDERDEHEKEDDRTERPEDRYEVLADERVEVDARVLR